MSKKALVVDESLENRIMFGRFFQWMGLNVVQASSGAEAIRIYEEDPTFDLVLVGGLFSGVDSVTVTKLIRQIQVAKRPYIVGIGDHSQYSDRHTKAGMDGFMVKPGLMAAQAGPAVMPSRRPKNVVPLFGG